MTPITLLKLEGLAVLATATLIYHRLGFSWWLYIVLFLVPDLFMLGYLAGKKIGAAVYNFGHTYLIVLPIGVAAWLTDQRLVMAASLIWIAHIGFDRLLGFGLKYPSGFKETHLGGPNDGKNGSSEKEASVNGNDSVG